MSEVIVVGPDGVENVFPAGMPDAQIEAAMRKQYGGPTGAAQNLKDAAKDIGYSGVAGAGKVMSLLPRAVGAFQENLTGAGNFIRGLAGKPPQKSPIAEGAKRLAATNDQFFDEVGAKSRLTGYAKAGTEGAGSAIIGGGPMLANLFTGATAGLGGELGYQGTGGTEYGRIIGSLLGGLGGGLAASWDKPSTAANRELARNARGIPEEGWRQASENLRRMERSGARTGTLAEAFPGENPLLPAAKEARRAVPEGSMARRLANRDDDLQALGQTALNRAGPPVSQEAVTQAAIQAANARLQQVKDYRSGAYSAAKGSPAFGPTETYPPQVSKLAYEYLMGKAAQANTQVDKDAFSEVAKTFLTPRTAAVPQPPKFNLGSVGEKGFKVQERVPQPDKQVPVFKDSPFDVAKDLKQLQTELKPLAANATGGQALNRASVGEAYGSAQGIMKGFSPRYATAENRFRDISQQLYNPMREGPIGQIAGRTPPGGQPLPAASRLQQLVQDQSPADVASNAASLQRGSQDRDLIRDISRALMERRMEKGSLNPGQQIRGMEGSLEEQRLRSLIQAGGARPGEVMEPLAVADLLQRLRGPAEAIPNQPTTALGAIARPFTTVARAANTEGYRNMQEEIGQLLANPTPANLALLRKLAEQNPQLRDLLSGMGQGALTGGIVGATQK